jgi:hypothetical protein
MLNFLKDLMDEKINQYVNQLEFHPYENHIDQQNQNERIQDEFYYMLGRYEYLKKKRNFNEGFKLDHQACHIIFHRVRRRFSYSESPE